MPGLAQTMETALPNAAPSPYRPPRVQVARVLSISRSHFRTISAHANCPPTRRGLESNKPGIPSPPFVSSCRSLPAAAGVESVRGGMHKLLLTGVVLLWLTAMTALFMRDVWPAWTAQDP